MEETAPVKRSHDQYKEENASLLKQASLIITLFYLTFVLNVYSYLKTYSYVSLFMRLTFATFSLSLSLSSE